MNAVDVPIAIQPYVEYIDGRLLVAEEFTRNPRYLSFVDRLCKMHGPIPQEVVTLQTISEQRHRRMRGNNGSHTATIADAIKMFEDACRRKASDIHIRIYGDYAILKYRINGDLSDISQWTADYAEAICHVIYTSMADVADPTYQPSVTQDARIAKPEMLPEGLYGIRISSGPHSDGSFMVLRLLYASENVQAGVDMGERLRELGYGEDHIQIIRFLARRPTGITIIAGPTGSGKSTTLKHTLEGLSSARPELCIMSVEDPPEYPMSGVLQMPVMAGASSADREEAFGRAIRSAMRSDPDIMMIGEIRDQETARLAIRAAMTGHQVWTTLHANSAFNIINRMCDIMASPQMPDPIKTLADITVLSGLVSQRLVKTICPHCRIPLLDNKEKMPEDLLRRLSRVVDLERDGHHIYLCGPGCDRCSGGVKGRTVVAEVVATDPKLLECLREGGIDRAQEHWLKAQEGRTVIQHMIEKITHGLVDPAMAEAIVGPLTTDMVFRDGVLEKSEYAAHL